MLNLSVNFMNFRFLFLTSVLLIAAQDAPQVAITSPVPDSAVSEQVTIIGTTDVPSFTSSQLDFSYASNPTGTWFALQTSSQPVLNSSLFTWDTTLITDGEYVLRLSVFLADGSTQEVTVQVKVQNDTPILTPTPQVTPTQSRVDESIPTPFLVVSSPTPTRTPRPTPTPLPTNDVALEQGAIYLSIARGAFVILGLFVLAGIILRLRRY
jgi:hypothetical protein